MTSSPIWHPYTPGISGKELTVERAEGSWIYLKDGSRILDLISSWWVNLHGHSHPYIAQAIGNQANVLEQVIFSGFTHAPAENLARQVLELLPGNFAKVFFSDNGSTAVEVALKMALQYFYITAKPRKRILALANAYHGDTFGTMAVGQKGLFNSAFHDFLFEVEFIEPPYTTSIHTHIKLDNDPGLQKAKRILETGEVAAIIVEPLLQGSGGMKIYPTEWLEALYKHARTNDTLIIADEVFTGFYRTGKAFAGSHFSEVPDIVCLSKGLTAGFLPMGLTLCTDKVAEPFRANDYGHTFYHGHSFTANPLACAAALAGIDLIKEAGFESRIESISNAQRDFTAKVNHDFPDYEARSIGTISAVTVGGSGAYSYTHPIRHKMYPYFLEKGLLLRPLGNVLYMVPPYCITRQELETAHLEITHFLKTET